MQGKPKDFWGKIGTDTAATVTSWQPLEARCADVAAVTEPLLYNTVFRSRFGTLLGQKPLRGTQVARLCVLAALHDVGKVNHSLQDRAYSRSGPRTGHVSPFMDFMHWNGPESDEIIAAVALASICEGFDWEDDCVAFLLASFCHHAHPIHSSPHFRPELWRVNEKRAPLEEMRDLRRAANSWFPEALDANALSFPHSIEFQHAFNDLLTLADWIGSDEDFFPYADDNSDRTPFARQRTSEAILHLGLAPKRFRAKLEPNKPGFEAIAPAGYSPYPIQRECGFPRTRWDSPLLSRLREMGVGIC